MEYISNGDLGVITLLLLLAAIIVASVLVGFASLFPDSTDVRPMTEAEFDRLLSRPPN